MGILDSCKKLFKTKDLYKVLSVSKDASEAQIKKGYHKVSLKVHPDRVGTDEKEKATQKFQAVGKVYCILSDKDKRALYDESGEVDEEDDMISQDKDWYDYWRILFHQVTEQDIKEFEEKYKGSEEELKDLKEQYSECEGDIELIIEGILCATIEDEPRFTKILKDLIKKKEVPEFPKFKKSTSNAEKSSRKRKAKEEAAEAEEHGKKLGLGDQTSLQAMIQSRQQSRKQQMNSFFDDMEARYAEPENSKTQTKSKTKSKKK